MTELMLFDESAGSARLLALKSRHNLLVQATKEVLSDGLDFGKIPGTGDKPTLLKPGAEKLCFLFGLRPTFEVVESIEDWQNGLFYYRYRCTLHDVAGGIIADGEGSCNSREKKYRYRNAQLVCPQCGKETVFKSKSKPEFYCWNKRGGCGATFPLNDTRITEQEQGQIENTEPYDLVNTLQKMAQKRALVAAVLVGTGASQFFTQDVEDMQTIDIETTSPKPEHKPMQAKQPAQRSTQPPEPPADLDYDGNLIDEGKLEADIKHAVEVVGAVPADLPKSWQQFPKYVVDHMPYYTSTMHVVNTLKALFGGGDEKWSPWGEKYSINGDPAAFWNALVEHAQEGKEV